MTNGIPCLCRVFLTARRLAIETGCPPPVLLVMVIMPKGILAAPFFWIHRSSLSRSIFPLKGASKAGSNPSSQTKSTAWAPANSIFARVVSKWLLLGITSPGLTWVWARMPSAARPWWVGKMCLAPVISLTVASNFFHDLLPA